MLPYNAQSRTTPIVELRADTIVRCVDEQTGRFLVP